MDIYALIAAMRRLTDKARKGSPKAWHLARAARELVAAQRFEEAGALYDEVLALYRGDAVLFREAAEVDRLPFPRPDRGQHPFQNLLGTQTGRVERERVPGPHEGRFRAVGVGVVALAHVLLDRLERDLGTGRAELETTGHAGRMSNDNDSVKQRLQSDLTAAMKSRDGVTTSTLRMVRAAIMNAEVAGDTAVELDDDQVTAVLRSEAKKRGESAQVYADAGRDEAAAKERAELAVIERYLPAAMSDDDLAAIVDAEVATAAANGAEGGKAMGMVIKAVRERAGDGADGGRVAAMVKARLSG